MTPCIFKGWVEDPNFGSHCKSGNFNDYNEDIHQAISKMKNSRGEEYETILGYAHSTGGAAGKLVILQYLLATTC